MLKRITRGGITALVAVTLMTMVVSCEEDFTDVAVNIINNNKFDTKDTFFEVTITPRDIEAVRADGLEIGGALGQYLIGIYKLENYKRLDASVVSQLTINPSTKKIDLGLDVTYSSDTVDVITTIDTAFIKLPYQVTLNAENEFELDSIFGDRTKPVTVNVYQSNRFLNTLNPDNPAVGNEFLTNEDYEKIAGELNVNLNYEILPSVNDTIFTIYHRHNTGAAYDTVNLSLTDSQVPFARIPLKEDKVKELFYDEFEGSNFLSQDDFNNYFRGLIIEPVGDDNALISFNFNTSTAALAPSIEMYLTHSVYYNGEALDTIPRRITIPLGGVRNSVFEMTPNNTSTGLNFPIQGSAGSHAVLDLFGPDSDNNDVPDLVEELRSNKWLINDASVIVYVDKNVVGFDTINTPVRLFLYKERTENNAARSSQITDIFSEGSIVYGGFLELTDDTAPESYRFRITDFISNIVNGEDNYYTDFVLKVANPIDVPGTDTLVRNYSWNPKAVMLLNNNIANGDRRLRLKISYTERKD